MMRRALLLAFCACHEPARAPAPEGGLTYEVRFEDEGQVHVAARFPPGLGDELLLDDAMLPYVREVATAAGPLARTGDGWHPSCARGCQVRWTVDLDAAARGLHDYDYAERAGAFVLASPSSYLLRPALQRDATFRFHVAASEPFLSGVTPAGPDTYAAPLADLPNLPYSGAGRFRARRVQLADSVLEVAFVTATPTRDERLLAWIEASAATIRGYFGRFALPRAAIFVLPSASDEVDFGTTMGHGGGAVVMRVGERVTDDALRADWQLTHEMVHLSLPDLPMRWLGEGLATYVEPIARARRGLVTPEQVWRDFVHSMHFGLPLPDEGGLDDTPTWGRTYWGGALFCLLADLTIRERTGNQRSLDDALRAVQAAGGNASVRWSMERFMEVGDRATGTRVLTELYEQMGKAPLRVDLRALWRRLGILTPDRHTVRFDDAAPLAAVRAAIAGGSSVPHARPPIPSSRNR